MFGSSRGPRQAKNKHCEIQNRHFWARPRKCEKWTSGSAIRNVQMSIGNSENYIFEPSRAREKSKKKFADVPRWPTLGHARFRKCRNGQESLKMLEKCRFWHMLEEPGAESATKLSACQGLALQKMCKIPAFGNVFVEARPQKSGSEPLRYQNERVQAAPKLRKCRKRASRASNWARGLRPSLKKRVKTHGFRNLKKNKQEKTSVGLMPK